MLGGILYFSPPLLIGAFWHLACSRAVQSILKDGLSAHQVSALCIGACVTATQVSKAGTDSEFGFRCNLNAVVLNYLLTEI